MTDNLSESMQAYFNYLDKGIKSCYEIAERARNKNLDPEKKVDIPLALDMAERIEGLISAVVPQLWKSGVAERIRELEKKYGSQDWRTALTIACEVAKQKYCKFTDEKEAMETGIRVGLAYITLGIICAPLEGFIDITLKNTKDGKKYMAVNYAGPIRASGGTASAVSVIIADYVRMKMGYARYDPDENEVKRYCTELDDYHDKCSNLQYKPSREEVEFLIRHISVEIDGDPTEEVDVSNYKDLPRLKSNKIRGGMCLVLGEGVAQKASKLYSKVGKWGPEFELEWMWLKEFLDLQKLMKAKKSATVDEKKEGDKKAEGEKKEEVHEKPKIMPNFTFIKDLVAGRPILTFPLAHGGFRLRYGRSRTSGFAAYSIHPATMIALDKFIATGTQLKVERPGKATVLSPCDTIEGPVVKLVDGTVLRLENEEDAKKVKKEVDEIIYLGDLLVAYGDFVENGHILVPAGYCEEWYAQELEKSIVNTFGSLDSQKVADFTGVDAGIISALIKQPMKTRISAQDAMTLSKMLNVPLHPYYTFHWNAITREQFETLTNSLELFNPVYEENELKKLVITNKNNVKRMIELLGIPHRSVNKEFSVLNEDFGSILLSNLNYNNGFDAVGISQIINDNPKDSTLSLINKISKIQIRDKSGTFVGARMGRPEKAKMRKLTGAPHTLFPVAEEGGRLRSFQSALEKNKVTSDFPLYKCETCKKETIFPLCETCNRETKQLYYCRVCDRTMETQECSQHGKGSKFKRRPIEIGRYFHDAVIRLGMPTYPDLIKGVRGTSNKDHTPENLVKGILRAKYDIYVNKDGTTRYDMIQMPITHFRPKEIGTSTNRLKELGYLKDIKGEALVGDDQILELKPQDIILPCCPESNDEPADEVLFRITKFIDELLDKHYKIGPFYNLNSKEELVGHLLINLAPHTSAGSISRIIGFSKTQGMFCHPLGHAATRRNCDGDEAGVMLLMDGLLNFSRQFLPDKRGGRTMDACLVLTAHVVPTEVDSEVQNVDIAWKYPLELYEAALQYKPAYEVKVKQIGQTLGTNDQYEGMGFTHDTEDFNLGVRCSAYKLLPSMQEKLMGQMELARKIRAVDASEVATMVIEKHFIRDIKGNLRKFSEQSFRCVSCNNIYRRPPLVGHCECGGKVIFTISEGSIVKYLEPSLSLAEKYKVPAFLRQSLMLLQRRIEGVFGKDKEKQSGLKQWFG
jgi:DNA polymerase II large subunit